MMLPILLPLLISQSPAQPMDWQETLKHRNDLLDKMGGAAVVLAITREANGRFLIQWDGKQKSSSSAWKLEIIPHSVSRVKGDTSLRKFNALCVAGKLHFEGREDFDFKIPESFNQFEIKLMTTEFKGMGQIINIPSTTEKTKILVLHCPQGVGL